MADNFSLNGSYQTNPTSGSPSGIVGTEAPLDEKLVLIRKQATEIHLTVDSPVSVPFGGVLNAHVFAVKSVGGKVRVRLTSADGATQAIPVDSFAIIICQSVPFTAIDLTRVSGTDTTCEVFLGEKA